MARFESDHRSIPYAPSSVIEQLRSGVEPVALLDAIFGLSYLVPKYQLKWAGKNIDELSPGERGTLLLIFYLLIDRRDIPLIIDQPEDNLDNQTVYDMLVACLREARTVVRLSSLPTIQTLRWCVTPTRLFIVKLISRTTAIR
jgi:hypothetical protein